MVLLPKRWLVPTLTILALSAFAIVQPGCGSSDDETNGASTVSGDSTTATSAPPAEKAGKQEAAKPERQEKARSQGGSKQPDQGKTNESKIPEEQGQSKRAGGQKGGAKGSVCPSGMSRAECKRRIEAADTATPGGEISSPSDCTDVMPKQQCEEIVRAQEGAEKNAGKSVSPETCLEEYSREFCEERFKEQYEQQAGQ